MPRNSSLNNYIIAVLTILVVIGSTDYLLLDNTLGRSFSYYFTSPNVAIESQNDPEYINTFVKEVDNEKDQAVIEISKLIIEKAKETEISNEIENEQNVNEKRNDKEISNEVSNEINNNKINNNEILNQENEKKNEELIISNNGYTISPHVKFDNQRPREHPIKINVNKNEGEIITQDNNVKERLLNLVSNRTEINGYKFEDYLVNFDEPGGIIRKDNVITEIDFNLGSPIFCFVHIPKSGGSSFNHHMRDKYFGGQNSFFYYSKQKKIQAMKPDGMVRYKFMSSHDDLSYLRLNPFKKKNIYLGTILREPSSRGVSLFNYIRPNTKGYNARCPGVEVDQGYQCGPVNHQTEMLAGAMDQRSTFPKEQLDAMLSDRRFMLKVAMKNLDEMFWFGINKHFDDSIKMLEIIMKLPHKALQTRNKSRKYNKPGNDILDRYKSINDLDVILYDYALQIFYERRKVLLGY